MATLGLSLTVEPRSRPASDAPVHEQMDQSAVVLEGHTSNVTAVMWSPDGRQLASADDDGKVRVWDAEKGRTVRILRGHQGRVIGIAWSPDGSHLATAGSDRVARVWDVVLGRTLVVIPAHRGLVLAVAWSPDGRRLVTAGSDRVARLWEAATGHSVGALMNHHGAVNDTAWSNDGKYLATASSDGTVGTWDGHTGDPIARFEGHQGKVVKIAWNPDGNRLATTSEDRTARVWDVTAGRPLAVLEDHGEGAVSLAWSPDGRRLATAGGDQTARIWDTATASSITVLEGPRHPALALAWSPDGKHLATTSIDMTVHMWDAATGRPLVILEGHRGPVLDIAWSPDGRHLATASTDMTVRLWDILAAARGGEARYRNAKVVLIGDTGVGKTGLACVLGRDPWTPTDSTHGRQVKPLLYESDMDGESREVILWDLAGQPGYRFVHQLHLHETTVALIVFDGRSEIDPFAGVRHWDRALHQAMRSRVTTETAGTGLVKFLVNARIDRGGVNVSRARITALANDLGCTATFETSAKEGLGVEELREAIFREIDWAKLPYVVSTWLFQEVRAFLYAQRKRGRVLATMDDLWHAFQQRESSGENALTINRPPATRYDFVAGVKRAAHRDLVRLFTFGDLVLLEPEKLDAYASALVIAARDEPDGMGHVPEEDVLSCRFPVPTEDRLADKEPERLLLYAMVEDLLAHEIAFRETTPDGTWFVFPSQFAREHPDTPQPPHRRVMYAFEGAPQNVYSTLVVRLIHSGLFASHELWRNAVELRLASGSACGVWMRIMGDGRAELTLSWDDETGANTQFQFEQFIESHLRRRAVPESVSRRPVVRCADCNTPFSDLQVHRRQERGHETMTCTVCDNPVSIVETPATVEQRIAVVLPLDRAADAKREVEEAKTRVAAKRDRGHYDVFLCHNSQDIREVERIAERFVEAGIAPWLDIWCVAPGTRNQRAIVDAARGIPVAVVFLGHKGEGPWQEEEVDLLIALSKGNDDRRVIPVLLGVAPPKLKNPPDRSDIPASFLTTRTWIDFRADFESAFAELLAAMHGKPARGPWRYAGP